MWPHVLAHSFGVFSSTSRLAQPLMTAPEFSKNGDLEPLKFPLFNKEILQQNYWSPADDLGRIKIVISEGFPRDSLTMPIERVKNVVAFSFQHAPLGKSWQTPRLSTLVWLTSVIFRCARELCHRVAQPIHVASLPLRCLNAHPCVSVRGF